MCRGWFKETKADPTHNFVSNPYLFAGSNNIGMTNCAPVLNQAKKEDTPEFVAALCTDSDISGQMESYFPMSEKTQEKYLIIDKELANI